MKFNLAYFKYFDCDDMHYAGQWYLAILDITRTFFIAENVLIIYTTLN
jgi:hypothetical protein